MARMIASVGIHSHPTGGFGSSPWPVCARNRRGRHAGRWPRSPSFGPIPPSVMSMPIRHLTVTHARATLPADVAASTGTPANASDCGAGFVSTAIPGITGTTRDDTLPPSDARPCRRGKPSRRLRPGSAPCPSSTNDCPTPGPDVSPRVRHVERMRGRVRRSRADAPACGRPRPASQVRVVTASCRNGPHSPCEYSATP